MDFSTIQDFWSVLEDVTEGGEDLSEHNEQSEDRGVQFDEDRTAVHINYTASGVPYGIVGSGVDGITTNIQTYDDSFMRTEIADLWNMKVDKQVFERAYSEIRFLLEEILKLKNELTEMRNLL